MARKKLGDLPPVYSPEPQAADPSPRRRYRTRPGRTHVNEVRRVRYGLSSGSAYLLQAYVEVVLQDLRARNQSHTANKMTVEQLVGAIVTTFLLDHSEEIRERYAQIRIEQLGPLLSERLGEQDFAAVADNESPVADIPHLGRAGQVATVAHRRAAGGPPDIAGDGNTRARKAYPTGRALPEHLRRKTRGTP